MEMKERRTYGDGRLGLVITPLGWWRLQDQSGPTRLDIGSGLLGSKSARAQTTRHRPGPGRLDIGPDPIVSTSNRARSSWHQSGPACLGIIPGSLVSMSAQATRHRPGPGRLDFAWLDFCSGLLGSTWAWARSARHLPGPAWLNIGLGPLGSTST